MKKLMKSSLFFSFTVLMGVTLFFSSCSRQQGAVSYNNEKLQKQSFEIENSKYSYSSEEKQSVSTIENEENNSTSIQTASSVTAATAAGKIATTNAKPSLAQKMVIKKMTKKLSPEEKMDTKRGGGIDQKLKLAIIFAIVGIIAGIFSWWLGTILIIIALIFLLLWAVENL